MCSYCGENSESRDHVPSRILLDYPFPENIPNVPCCLKCNQGFSHDEEYFACAIECFLNGTADLDKQERPKIKSILAKKESLRQRIQDGFVVKGGETYFQFEKDRLDNVLIKLAKGHARFENSDPVLEKPASIFMWPLTSATHNQVDTFFELSRIEKAPEVGSRSLQNLLISDQDIFPRWMVVQENCYQYAVEAGWGTLTVKILLWNKIAVEVAWK
jgi:hypothetical protein